MLLLRQDTLFPFLLSLNMLNITTFSWWQESWLLLSMTMLCHLESRLGVGKLWTKDQILHATFVNKFWGPEPHPSVMYLWQDRAELLLQRPFGPQSLNTYCVNIYKNIQKRLADPWPRSWIVRAAKNIVQPALLPVWELWARDAMLPNVTFYWGEHGWL